MLPRRLLFADSLRNQALAQVCAVCSPFSMSMSEIDSITMSAPTRE